MSAKNGYINNTAECEIINTVTAKSAVVQVTKNGTRTLVAPKNQLDKEKLLLAIILALVMFCGILIIAVFTRRHYSCTDERRTLCLTEECVRTASSLLSAMDQTMDPCTDFFQYACGTWNKMHVIPEDKSSISTFEVMADQLQVVLKGLLEDPINLRDNDATRKAKLFYNSCTNLSDIRRIGDKPIRQIIAQLGGWPVLSSNWTAPSFSVETLLGIIRSTYNEGYVIEQWVGPDDKDSSANILQIDQSVLALPSRDYYLKLSSRGDLDAYHKYMTNIAILLGANSTTAAKELLEIMEFERKLANASLPEQDRHDTSLIYNKMTLRDLSRLVPQIRWLEYFRTIFDIEINENENIVTYGLPYFVELGRILATTKRRLQIVPANKPDIVLLDHQQKTMFAIELVGRQEEKRTKCQELLGQLRRLWPDYAISLLLIIIGSLGLAVHILATRMQKAVILESLYLPRTLDSKIDTIHNYVIWRLVMSLSSFLIDDYQKERVEFRQILQGVLSERHRWSQCVEWVNKKMGMAVGALYVRDHFDPDSKETALEMIHTIREAFNELLVENEWMDEGTKKVAKEKADAMNERIGYPQMIMDKEELCKEYELLNITKHEFLKNMLNALRFEAQQNFNKLRQPVDKKKWSTDPAVVNAFYNPNRNDIVFPAGILQPLFYSQHSPKSLNYGGIGVVIGHEITHGFDDKGRQFDKDGNMMQWWNNATIRAFRERTQCIIDQYSRYKIDEVDLYVNGRMTQGENIADNGGLKQSFRAYRKWVSQHGEELDLPGLNLTHDQLFFLNYAQIWCGSMRPEDALSKVRSSVHSPGPIRVLGPLSNSHDFAKAYNCPVGSPMNPTDKCSVW